MRYAFTAIIALMIGAGMANAYMTNIESGLLQSFMAKDDAGKARTLMLAANAEFVLRMTADTTDHTEVGKTVLVIREALLRGVRN